MKFKLTVLITLISALPIFAHANTALEVQPKDVYKAAYCAEINRLSGFPDYEQVRQEATEEVRPFKEVILSINLEPSIPKVRKDPISELAAKLITGGDNLDFVDAGIENARRDISFISRGVLTKCNIDLVKILENYNWMPCGYGRLRQINKWRTKKILSKLEMSIP